jgi:hypothetical protein
MKRWVGLGVIADNLMSIANAMAKQETSPGLDDFARLNPAHKLPPARRRRYSCLFGRRRTPERLFCAGK